jgi:hypothetical protein
MGRPYNLYTPELAKKICDTIATTPKSLIQICRENPDFPHYNTIYAWLYRYPEFNEMYYHAKMNQIEPLMDKMLHLAQCNEHDFEDITKPEKFRLFHERKLEIDTYKWLAMNLLPKRYGTKGIENQGNETEGIVIARKIVQECKILPPPEDN